MLRERPPEVQQPLGSGRSYLPAVLPSSFEALPPAAFERASQSIYHHPPSRCDMRATHPEHIAKMQSLAQLAREIAEQVQGPEGWRNSVRGYAAGHVANSLRVPGELAEAEVTLIEAKRLVFDQRGGLSAAPTLTLRV